MKPISIALLASTVVLVSCTGFEQELDPSSDPLKSPYANLKKNADSSGLSASSSQAFQKGQTVETSMPGAEFFKGYPVFRKTPDRELPVSTKAKILSTRGSYSKVRLAEGTVGYVPSIMLIEAYDNDSSNLVEVASSSDVPVLDPLSEEEILRRIDEEEALLKQEQETLPAPGADDFVAPEPEVLGIGQPTDLRAAEEAVTQEMKEAAANPAQAVPPAAPQITIDKPSDTLPSAPIDAPAGDQIIQDAALE